MTELKDLLKPPFAVDGLRTSDGYISFSVHYPKRRYGGKYEKDVKKFLEEALIEKWERDFGEPKRWEKWPPEIHPHPSCRCPECKLVLPRVEQYNKYCPSCGTRLDPPEDKNDNTN